MTSEPVDYLTAEDLIVLAEAFVLSVTDDRLAEVVQIERRLRNLCPR